MSDMDDFFLDDSDLAEDNQLTIVDSTRVRLVDSIIELSKKIKENINFNEQTDAASNIRILARNLDSLIKLSSADSDKMSDEELQEFVDTVLKETTEITLENMNDILPDDEGETVEDIDDSDESGLDF